MIASLFSKFACAKPRIIAVPIFPAPIKPIFFMLFAPNKILFFYYLMLHGFVQLCDKNHKSTLVNRTKVLFLIYDCIFHWRKLGFVPNY
ncbi:hypothetical protein FH025_11375 [Listeria monocytogenes]|nr:hypothetical protein [Listeria monocytogenes]